MKIDVIRFQYRTIPASADHAFDAMCEATRNAGHSVFVVKGGNALVHVSRNRALARLRADTEWVLFVDDDMIPQPTAALKMLAHNLPVVSAVCTNREHPVEIAAKLYDQTHDAYRSLNWAGKSHVNVGKIAVGAAFLLTSKGTIDALIEHHLSARDWLEDHRPEMDRMRVRAELREAERARKERLRREMYVNEKLVRVFDYPITDTERQLGEDIGLSRRLIQLGIPVAIDSNVIVGHLGEYTYGPWDIGMDEERSVA